MLGIGPSTLVWDGDALVIKVDEISIPLPRRLRGVVRLEPEGVNMREFTLDEAGRHVWRPIAPSARVEMQFDSPSLRWSGQGYFDTNYGSEPLEAAFRSWTWSRASLPNGAAILYDAERRAGGPLSLALRFDKTGACEEFEAPKRAALPRSNWLVARSTRADDGKATLVRTLEDTPFYARSEIDSRMFGYRVRSMHESLSLDRFRNPIVQSMLPFRMPRR